MAAAEIPADEAQPVQRPLIMRYAARSDVGRIRAKNDDSAYVGRHLAVVADGMGGHAGGDVASAATVLDMLHLDHGDYDGDAGTVLADEIQTANSLLSELVHINPKLAGMGTTVTALLLAEGKLHFAHIGDSRAYRLRDGVFEQVSIDHTFVQRLIDEGRLRPEEAETHPHKNVLMRVLGDVDASPELDLDTLEVKPGERWLLCSDGLNYVAGHVVERTIRETKDLRECVETLVNLTLEAGSPDNVTVVMLEIVEETPDDVSTAAVEIVPAVPVTAVDAPGPSATKPAAEAEPDAAAAPDATEPGAETTSAQNASGETTDAGKPDAENPTPAYLMLANLTPARLRLDKPRLHKRARNPPIPPTRTSANISPPKSSGRSWHHARTNSWAPRLRPPSPAPFPPSPAAPLPGERRPSSRTRPTSRQRKRMIRRSFRGHAAGSPGPSQPPSWWSSRSGCGLGTHGRRRATTSGNSTPG